MKVINVFIVKSLECNKGKIFSKNFVINCVFYGLHTEPEPEPQVGKSQNQNQNRNFSKVGTGTGTVKNSYISTKLLKRFKRI